MPPIEELQEPRPPTGPARIVIPAANPAAKPAARRRSYRSWIVLGVLVRLVVWYFTTHRPVDVAAAGHASQGPVPVTVGVVAKKDVPIYLTGIGTVQAFNTVTVHSRVDGQIVKVAFTEGQDVKAGGHAGDDRSRAVQTAFDQAVGKQGQDQAQLANAQLDMTRDTDMLSKRVISSQQYDTQKALVEQLQATVAADTAAVESARVQLDYATIQSPLTGRVGIRQIDQGNIIHAADTNGLVVITAITADLGRLHASGAEPAADPPAIARRLRHAGARRGPR